ncbi:hypothetical protein ACTPOK_00420 [Streptomyces inhibens]|uniref:hypothetical protein n=1 Tax=Streptomyces inhibens TaxID=2293571 RepID=UPI00402A5EE3
MPRRVCWSPARSCHIARTSGRAPARLDCADDVQYVRINDGLTDSAARLPSVPDRPAGAELGERSTALVGEHSTHRGSDSDSACIDIPAQCSHRVTADSSPFDIYGVTRPLSSREHPNPGLAIPPLPEAGASRTMYIRRHDS